MRTFNGLQVFTTQLTNSGQLDARYIIRNDVLGPEGQADFGSQSSIRPLSVGGVIAGGAANVITGNYASIGGGEDNIADLYAFVGGGYNNQAIDGYSVIGGGVDNIVGSYFGFVGGGCNNFLSIRPKTGPGSNNAPATYSSIINGSNNIIDGNWSLIGGGLENLITGGELLAFNNILGGWCNSIRCSEMSTILGGRMNVISGQNLAQATPDFIGGGCLNKAYNHGNFIGGGQNNTTNYFAKKNLVQEALTKALCRYCKHTIVDLNKSHLTLASSSTHKYENDCAKLNKQNLKKSFALSDQNHH